MSTEPPYLRLLSTVIAQLFSSWPPITVQCIALVLLQDGESRSYPLCRSSWPSGLKSVRGYTLSTQILSDHERRGSQSVKYPFAMSPDEVEQTIIDFTSNTEVS